MQEEVSELEGQVRVKRAALAQARAAPDASTADVQHMQRLEQEAVEAEEQV